jgi:hypothetical protein
MFPAYDASTLLDPLTTLIKIGLLREKMEGTKLSIYDHKIGFDEPTALQGATRWKNGCKREDLHRLEHPTKKFMEWYPVDKKGHFKHIMGWAIEGLNCLKKTYEKNEKLSSNLVSHAIAHYISEYETFQKEEHKTREHEITEYPAIGEQYKEFSSFWLYEEISFVVFLLKLIQIKKNKKLNYSGLIITLETFLDSKDEQFVEMTFKLKNTL